MHRVQAPQPPLEGVVRGKVHVGEDLAQVHEGAKEGGDDAAVLSKPAQPRPGGHGPVQGRTRVHKGPGVGPREQLPQVDGEGLEALP